MLGEVRLERNEIEELRSRLAEMEQALEAIRGGDVNAVFVRDSQGPGVYTLETASLPYRELIEQMSEGAASISEEGALLFCNKRLAEMVGRPLENILGAPVNGLIPRSERAAFAGLLNRSLNGEAEAEIPLEHADGRLVPVQVSLRGMKTDQGRSVCMVVTNLTELKEAVKAVQLQAYCHDTLVSTTSDGYWRCDLEGHLLDVNDMYCRMSGYLRDELLKMSKADLEASYDADRVHELLRQLIRNGFARFESQHRKKDGSVFDVEISASYLAATSDLLFFVRDITGTKEARHYARSLIEVSLDPLVTINAEGRITDVNEATIKATGVSREELVGTDFASYFTHPEKARRGYLQAFSRGFVTDYPLTIRHAGGRLTDVLYNASVYTDRAGKVLGVFAAARDISRTKEASHYARSLIEASLDPLVTISAQGKITDVNEATVRATGVLREKLIGSDFADYFSEPEKARAGYSEAFKAGSVRDCPLTLKSTGGKSMDVLYNASVYHNTAGEVAGVFAAARDVTLINEATRYARSLFETNLNPLIIVGAEGKITDTNEAMIGATGMSREDLIGDDFADIFTEPESARALCREVLEKGFAHHTRLKLKNSSGDLLNFCCHAIKYRDQAGEVVGTYIDAHDFTGLQHIQDSLDQLNRSLVEANKDLESFSYSVSHDLRAPLRAIDSFSKFVIDDCGPKLGPEGQRQLGIVRSSAQKMGQLIEDILAFSRAGRREMTCVPIDMTGVFRKAFAEHRMACPERQFEFDLEDLPVVSADRPAIQQVVANLLGNAIKFTRERDVARIHVSAVQGDGETIFSIADNGAGFDARYADKLFSMFQRLHGVEEFEGSGVGLAIVKRYIDKHHGRVWAEGEASKGATFYFSLPPTPATIRSEPEL